MATETTEGRRTRGTTRLQTHLLLRDLPLTTRLALLALLTTPVAAISTATPGCGGSVHFTYPVAELAFARLDAVNVTYRSRFAHPTLVCVCGEAGRVIEKFRVDNAAPFAGSELVLLDFESADPCWFHLKPDAGQCGGDIHDGISDWANPQNSPRFILQPRQRPGSAQTTIDAPAAIPARTQTAIAKRAASSPPDPTASNPAALNSTTSNGATTPSDQRGGRLDLGPGAKAGIGVGIAALVAAAGAMAAFLYFRRRKKNQNAELADAIIDHDRRHGRRAPEKIMGWDNPSSVATARSDEPLYPPPQPVPDGFPGSMGYDDVRSLHSTDHPSPTNGRSPSLPHSTGYWTERDELSAARLKSQIPVTSYGPNPVTPTLTPRPSSRVDLNVRAGSVSTDSREGIPPVPLVPLMPDYSAYSIPPLSSSHRESSPSPPRKPAIPIVVSYGPNRVTPTPVVTTPTVPPDETIFKRTKEPQFYLQTTTTSQVRPVTSHERRVAAWEDDEELAVMTASAMGPLPPYASTADFYAMEKGAIRKLAEPQAEAELPPTKDGFYHGYGASEVVEYELQGAAPQHEPQLPFHPQAYRRDPGAPGPSLGGGAGGRSGPGFREIDEQKFLLSPDMLMLKGEKVKRGRLNEQNEQGDGQESRNRGKSTGGSRGR